MVDDMVDDIVHETAHAVEEKYGADIFFDGELEQEFLGKRETLYRLLSGTLSDSANLDYRFYMDPDFNHRFDQFLYKIKFLFVFFFNKIFFFELCDMLFFKLLFELLLS